MGCLRQFANVLTQMPNSLASFFGVSVYAFISPSSWVEFPVNQPELASTGFALVE